MRGHFISNMLIYAFQSNLQMLLLIIMTVNELIGISIACLQHASADRYAAFIFRKEQKDS